MILIGLITGLTVSGLWLLWRSRRNLPDKSWVPTTGPIVVLWWADWTFDDLLYFYSDRISAEAFGDELWIDMKGQQLQVDGQLHYSREVLRLQIPDDCPQVIRLDEMP